MPHSLTMRRANCEASLRSFSAPVEDHQRVYSEVTAERLDAEVERLITQAHQQARSVLTEHRDALDRLAQALLQEEVLEREQVLAIVNEPQKTQGAVSSEFS